jgi:16S rRNA processing protein RimM
MFLKIGIVGRALGLQGSFYISGRDEPIPSSITWIKIGKSLETAREAEVLKTAWQKNRASIKCSLANDRTAAELLQGMSIWVEASQIKVTENHEFLLIDLVGRDVIDVEGRLVGLVESVLKQPASINMLVVNNDRSADVEIPMIADYVDMSFRRGENVIYLKVDQGVFSDIWNLRGKK